MKFHKCLGLIPLSLMLTTEIASAQNKVPVYNPTRSGTWIYRLTVESLDPGPGGGLNNARESLQKDLNQSGPLYKVRTWDNDHLSMSVAVFSTTNAALVEKTVVYDNGADNYFSTVYWNEATKTFQANSVDREVRGLALHPSKRKPTYPARAVMYFYVQPIDKERVGISVTADTRTALSTIEALKNAKDNNQCYISKRAETFATTGERPEMLPATPLRAASCDPIWSTFSYPNFANFHRLGLAVGEGCDGYSYTNDFIYTGKQLLELTPKLNYPYYIDGQVRRVDNPLGCWQLPDNVTTLPSNPTAGTQQNTAASRRARIKIERLDQHIVFDTGPVITPKACKLLPLASFGFEQNGLGWGQYWSDNGTYSGNRARVSVNKTVASPLNLSLTTRYDTDSDPIYGAVVAKAVPKLKFEISASERPVLSPIKPDSPHCSHFVNMPAPTQQDYLKPWGDNEPELDLADTVMGPNNVRASLYGEFNLDGKLLLTRLRYTTNRPATATQAVNFADTLLHWAPAPLF